MSRSFLIGSTALLFLIVLSEMVSFLLKYPEGGHHFFEKAEKGSVKVELIVNKQEQGIYYISAGNTLDEFLSQFDSKWGRGQKIIVADGTSIRIEDDQFIAIDEMAPHKKLALGILVDINQLSPEEMMFIPGIGEKTATSIYSYIKRKGCLRNLSELLHIPGIKERKIAAMRNYVTARPLACR